MPDLDHLFSQIGVWHRNTEAHVLGALRNSVDMDAAARKAVHEEAVALVERCRANSSDRPLADRFLQEYGLSNEEGVALLCLVESLLRIPDDGTAQLLIEEKLKAGSWDRHVSRSDSLFVNASTYALLLTGNYLNVRPRITDKPWDYFRELARRLGEPAMVTAMRSAVKLLSREFVTGESIESAVSRIKGVASFDMLGEGARTHADADRYFESYRHALEAVAGSSQLPNPDERSGISVKLSALHPRVEVLKYDELRELLLPRLLTLGEIAAAGNVQMTIDSEEASRTEVTLKLFQLLAESTIDRDRHVLGLAVQAYSKRAFAILDWMDALARQTNRRFRVRLVKGAYWDTEIKRAQSEGFSGYPVFTRKANTDVAYLACASRLFTCIESLAPQFATHNAHTLVAVKHLSRSRPYEFQRLQGMGELMYEQANVQYSDLPICRIYAPVGPVNELMAYLTRRLLENGANSSFVNRAMDSRSPAAELVKDPLDTISANKSVSHPEIPLPRDLFGESRCNSEGVDLGDGQSRTEFFAVVADEIHRLGQTSVMVGSRTADTDEDPPLQRVDRLFQLAAEAQPQWESLGASVRARTLVQFADSIKSHRTELICLLQTEGRKTIQDAISEIREAEDFVRYYAASAQELMQSRELPSTTGETNHLSLCARGVIGCISPWNFPAAIFIGQIVAALSTGNAVVAKPAPQTPQTAQRLVQLAHEEGISDVLQLATGDDELGRAIVRHDYLRGVAFTGSIAVAKAINRDLADRQGPIVPLIAETGGINAMIVDSSALLETLIDDVIHSAFSSAGQRCSALRLICCPDTIYPRFLRLLKGAMDALRVDDPLNPATDVGPLIDAEAKQAIEAYLSTQSIAHQTRTTESGEYVCPTVIEVDAIEKVQDEIFGPVLHVYRYGARDFDGLIDRINQLGFGLTFGIQSRIETTIERFSSRIRAGNTYVNRGMTGAVVGMQPFGGEALSGTGPKAGGPFYLQRFVVERVVSNNVAATGGDIDLLSMNL